MLVNYSLCKTVLTQGGDTVLNARLTGMARVRVHSLGDTYRRKVEYYDAIKMSITCFGMKLGCNVSRQIGLPDIWTTAKKQYGDMFFLLLLLLLLL